jgi:hypothetical protein
MARRVMDGLLDFLSGWQHLAKMPPPTGGVVAGSIAANRRPIEHRFNPSADAVGSLGLLLPNRLDALEYQAGVDGGDRKPADLREHVHLECRKELRSVLGISPPALVGVEILDSGALEGQRAGGLQGTRRPFGSAGVNRVDAIEQLLPRPSRARSRASFNDSVCRGPSPIHRSRPWRS